MAQTGYTPILIYASGTSTNVPLAANLTSSASGAELALNYADGKLYFKNSSGVVTLLAGSGGGGPAAGSNTQIQFNNSGVFGASSNLTWSGTALGVTGTVAVTGALTATLNSTFSSTGALTISKGTTGERPSAVSGMLRFNTTTTEFEGYNGTTWASVGGAALSNDTSTATNVYPLFANATSGTASTLYTSNAKLLYKPSTGEFQAPEMVANNGLFVNSATVATDYTIPVGSNAMSAGPVTVNSGITVTVSSGSVWTVI
jgi:hypothetical protein